MYSVMLLVLSIGASLFALPDASRAADLTSAEEQVASQMVDLINLERTREGYAALVLDPALSSAAQSGLAAFVASGCAASPCAAVPSLWDRLVASERVWTTLGESVLAGPPTPEAAAAIWLRSPAHRANLLNPRFRGIGVAAVSGDTRLGTSWMADLGDRADLQLGRPSLRFLDIAFQHPADATAADTGGERRL